MTVFSSLIGQKIVALIMPNNQELHFVTENGRVFAFCTEADCCNFVWFEHLNGVTFLLNGVVQSSEAKNWNELGEDDSGNYLEQGFWTIKTNKGDFDIEVRNAHNGYYGGIVVPMLEYEFNGNMITAITEDI